MENKDYKLILERLLDILDEGVYIVKIVCLRLTVY